MNKYRWTENLGNPELDNFGRKMNRMMERAARQTTVRGIPRKAKKKYLEVVRETAIQIWVTDIIKEEVTGRE